MKQHFAIMMFKYLVDASFTPLEISIFSSETLKLRLWVEFLIPTNGVFSVRPAKYFGLVKWIIKNVVNICEILGFLPFLHIPYLYVNSVFHWLTDGKTNLHLDF